jgi:hypothetical protein
MPSPTPQGRPSASAPTDPWPALPYEAWRETNETLHLWLQIAGKVRLALTPWVNHQWHITLYLTSRGLTTSTIPHGRETFQLDFDFHDHLLRIAKSDGRTGEVELRPRTVADFYHALMDELRWMELPVEIHGSPNEVESPIPFARDEVHGTYDADHAYRFWRAMASAELVLSDFRGRFIGKSSPVHLFWGAMDLAVTRFSGRRAPAHPGGVPHLPDWVTREAYSHEVSSAGFWAGGPAFPEPIFYSYAYPEPEGFPDAAVEPGSARWEPSLSEFILPYDAVRRAASPEKEILAFLQSTYEAAAEAAGWDRESLEWEGGGRPTRTGRRVMS